MTATSKNFAPTIIHDVSLGKVTHQITEAPGGRAIQIINQPLRSRRMGGHDRGRHRAHAAPRSGSRHLAHYDPLTDLPNRALFHERLKHELTRIAPGEQLAVLYIDIDEFKSVNDTLGHLIGDELLKSVAVSLSSCARGDGFVARLGGDEFAVVQTAVKTEAEVARPRHPDLRCDPHAL